MSNGKLICFIGLDGSGKSTISESLQKYFISKGIKTKKVWIKIGVPLINIPKIVYKIGAFFPKGNKSKNVISYGSFRILANPLIKNIYLVYILIDHWLQILIKVRLPLMRGYHVICDRYVHDSIVDLVTNFNMKYVDAKNIIKKLTKFPKPNYVFYLKVPPKIAFNRKNGESPMNYLLLKEKVYSIMAEDEEFDIIPLDGTRDKGTLFKEVINLIKRGNPNER